MGIPGSGKGTQGKLLAATRSFHIISTGELLRNYGSEEQHARMHKGEILGDEEVTEMLDKALSNLEDQDKTILDGYPRTVNQAKWLIAPDKVGRFKVDYVLHLKASREAVKKRLQDRGRKDDDEAVVEARFSEYEQATVPILDFMREQGIEVIEVDAEQPIEDVHQELISIEYDHRQKV